MTTEHTPHTPGSALDIEYQRWNEIARNPDAPIDQLATEGHKALWIASNYRSPELIPLASMMLERSIEDEAMQAVEPGTYFSARLALAFAPIHQDWADNAAAYPSSRLQTRQALADILWDLLENEQAWEGKDRLVCRTAFMALIARDEASLVVPAPPPLRFNSFMVVDNETYPCQILLRSVSYQPRVHTIIGGYFFWQALVHNRPDSAAQIPSPSHGNKYKFAVRYFGTRLIDEVHGESKDTPLLDEVMPFALRRLRPEASQPS